MSAKKKTELKETETLWTRSGFYITCPYCGAKELKINRYKGGKCSITCLRCGLAAPVFDSEEAAISAWASGIIDDIDLKRRCPFCGGKMQVFSEEENNITYIECSQCGTRFVGTGYEYHGLSPAELAELWENKEYVERSLASRILSSR